MYVATYNQIKERYNSLYSVILKINYNHVHLMVRTLMISDFLILATYHDTECGLEIWMCELGWFLLGQLHITFNMCYIHTYVCRSRTLGSSQ